MRTADLFLTLKVQRNRTLGVTWQSRKVMLTKEHLWIGKFDGNHVLDFIPLCEVSKIKTKEKRQTKTSSPLRTASFVGMMRSKSQRAHDEPAHSKQSHHEREGVDSPTDAGALSSSPNFQSWPRTLMPCFETLLSRLMIASANGEYIYRLLEFMVSIVEVCLLELPQRSLQEGFSDSRLFSQFGNTILFDTT